MSQGVTLSENQQMFVLKENGEKEVYDHSKVNGALLRVGISGKAADEILSAVEKKFYNGISTHDIYSLLYGAIDAKKPQFSHKFNLKRALMDLGPAGYSFEDFIFRLMKSDGYDVKIRQIVHGKCVSHEIDVVAAKKLKRFMIECKFHNEVGERCRMQTILYVYARFLDLAEGSRAMLCDTFHRPWLITNTKFSDDVIRYSECMDLPLLGWRYPFGDGLEIRSERLKCYPVTVIPIGPQIRERLFRKGIFTIAELPESANNLAKLATISISKAQDLIDRAQYAR